MKIHFKKVSFSAVILAAAIILVGCSGKADATITASEAAANDLTESASETAANSDSKTIQILTTTDTHGRFLPYDYAINRPDTSGSLVQIATKVDELRNENANTILVDAGDVIEDNSEALFINTDENPMMIAMNEMEYDILTLGNHEFNYGMDALTHVIGQFNGNVLCGNVYDNHTNERIAAPYTVIEKGGIKIGFIGMVTPNITRWDKPNLKNYTVVNPIDETKSAIKELQEQGVNSIVAVMHLSVNQEYGEDSSSAIEVIEACPEIDAFVAAHYHASISKAYCYNAKVYALNDKDGTVKITAKDGTTEVGTAEQYNTAKANGTVIIEAYKWAQALGQINITFTKDADGNYKIADKARDITTDMFYMSENGCEPVAEDAELSKILQPYSDIAIADANTPIGVLQGGNLVPENEIPGIEEAKLRPTAMITLIQNTQRYYGEQLCGHPIDVSSAAVFQYGPNLVEGEIKKCDTARIYMYDNSLYVLKITGKQLKQYMEWSYEYYNTYHPGDLTISFNPSRPGFDFDMFAGVNYDVNVAKEPGARIENLTKMDGSIINDTDELYLAINNYRATTSLLSYGTVFNEGDELPKLVATSDETSALGDGRIRDLIAYYIRDVKGGVIEPECDSNWRIIGNDWDLTQRAKAVECARNGTIELTGEAGEQTSENSVSITWDMVKDK